jgi:hypothetical protein
MFWLPEPGEQTITRPLERRSTLVTNRRLTAVVLSLLVLPILRLTGYDGTRKVLKRPGVFGNHDNY